MYVMVDRFMTSAGTNYHIDFYLNIKTGQSVAHYRYRLHCFDVREMSFCILYAYLHNPDINSDKGFLR